MLKFAKKLASRVRELRGNKSQREFAKEIGINQSTLHRIEKGNENVTLKTLQTMCDNLHCKIGWLFQES